MYNNIHEGEEEEVDKFTRNKLIRHEYIFIYLHNSPNGMLLSFHIMLLFAFIINTWFMLCHFYE